MVGEPKSVLYAEPGPDEDLRAKVAQLERTMALLLSDQAVGNTLKGPFRLPGHAKTSAFQ